VRLRARGNRARRLNDGRNQDVVLYSLLRDDPRPWHRDADESAVAGSG
jgi:hypothetical protein